MTSDDTRLWTIEKACEFFDDVHPATLRRWWHTVPGFPKPIKIRQSRYFIPSELKTFVQRQRDGIAA
jgi:hypothetical protein